MTLALLSRRPANSRPVIAADFSHQMLVRGAAKFSGRGSLRPRPSQSRPTPCIFPLADNSVDLITTAFGFRNLANYRAGLEEFHRVLRPGGELGILDFSEPGGLLGKLYAFYFRAHPAGDRFAALRSHRPLRLSAQLRPQLPAARTDARNHGGRRISGCLMDAIYVRCRWIVPRV